MELDRDRDRDRRTVQRQSNTQDRESSTIFRIGTMGCVSGLSENSVSGLSWGAKEGTTFNNTLKHFVYTNIQENIASTLTRVRSGIGVVTGSLARIY